MAVDDVALVMRLAWRNVLRNRRRTLLSGLAIGIGLGALIFTDALFQGMNQNMIRTATDTFLGQGQILRVGFRATTEVEDTVVGAGALLARLRADDRVAACAPRTQFFAMISSPANVAAVGTFGIDPDAERHVSDLAEAVRAGTYLDAGKPGHILLGAKLAATLEVGLGDRVVVTTAQAGSGELVQDMVRVAGLFEFGSRGLDDGVAFIDLARSRGLLGLAEDGAHQIVLRFTDLGVAGDRAHPFWQAYDGNGNEALGWRDLLPEMNAALDMATYSMGFVLFILFGIVALSVVNTLFMSLHERMFEFGVLRAVGTRPLRMAGLILAEAAGLALVSIVLGGLLGLALSAWVAHSGIDYGGIEYAGVTFRDRIYPIIEARQYVVYPGWVLAFSVIAGCYPAWHAARLQPAHAMRRSL